MGFKSLFYLFIPHPQTHQKAHLLSWHFLVIYILLFMFLKVGLDLVGIYKPGVLGVDSNITATQIIEDTNKERAKNNLPSLIENQALSNAAKLKAQNMFAENYWAHNSPDGTTPWFFIKEAGYNYVYAGENLARGFSNSKDVVNAWMASNAGHRDNILSSNFKDVGFAVKSGKLNGEETFLVVQELGSKNLLPVAASPNQKMTADKVLGFNISSYIPTASSFSTSSKIVLIFMVGFITILVIDMAVVKRKKIVRIVGHNIDHAIFMTAIILVISALRMGAII